MPVDRKFWGSMFFDEKGAPPWPCPNCSRGHLQLEKKSLHSGPDEKTSKNIGHQDFEPIFWTGRFSCYFTCSSKQCKETIAALGIESMGEGSHGQPESVYEPLIFFPPLHLFRIPDQTPQPIVNETVSAFALTWIDASGAMNHVRNAIELVMDHLKVPKSQMVTKSGMKRRVRRSLHNRIEWYTHADRVLRDRLLAIKWLGNEGSHAGVLTLIDTFDCHDLLESVLVHIFADHQRRLDILAKVINKARGPRKRTN